MSDDPEPILQTARTNIARVIDQLERDRAALAAKPQYVAGEQKLSAAKRAAVQLSVALEALSPSEQP